MYRIKDPDSLSMPDKRSISADDEEDHVHNGTPYTGKDQNNPAAIARDKLAKRA